MGSSDAPSESERPEVEGNKPNPWNTLRSLERFCPVCAAKTPHIIRRGHVRCMVCFPIQNDQVNGQ